MATSNTIKVKADVILGIGEYIKINIEVPVNDLSANISCIGTSGQRLDQISATSVVIQSEDPINTDILDGSPQTGVRLLVLVAEPV